MFGPHALADAGNTESTRFQVRAVVAGAIDVRFPHIVCGPARCNRTSIRMSRDRDATLKLMRQCYTEVRCQNADITQRHMLNTLGPTGGMRFALELGNGFQMVMA